MQEPQDNSTVTAGDVAQVLTRLDFPGLGDETSLVAVELGHRAGEAFAFRPRLQDEREALVGVIRVVPLRYRELEGELARWILASRSWEERRLVIVEVPTLTERVIRTVKARLDEWAPDVAWALVDASGALQADRKKLADDHGLVRRAPTEPSLRMKPAEVRASQQEPLKWTDTNALMAKWLFLARSHLMWGRVDNALGRAPRNALELARCVGVSPQTAYSFVDAFTRAGLIEVRRGEVDILDDEAFADAWLDAARQQVGSWNRYPVQWHGGPVRSRSELLHLCEQLALEEGRLIVGGFAAAELQEWLHLRDYPLPMLHWSDHSGLLAPWMDEHRVFPLPPGDARDAHFWIAESPWPRSVWAMATLWPPGPHRPARCRVADALQIAMDCIGEPRGEEQASELLDRAVFSRKGTLEWQ